jgi:hypothetical protein
MLASLHHLHCVPILVVAIIGFALGALWYSVLFGKAWMAEMKLTPPADGAKPGMAGPAVKGFLWTLVSTFALWVLIDSHGSLGYRKGAIFGAVVGLLIVGARYANSGAWERKSCKLLAINIGHEVALFVVQGAIFGHWR